MNEYEYRRRVDARCLGVALLVAVAVPLWVGRGWAPKGAGEYAVWVVCLFAWGVLCGLAAIAATEWLVRRRERGER